jgi:PKD repeat protein
MKLILRRHFLFVMLTLLVATSCKKKELPESSAVNQPVFSFNGTVDGAPVDIKAGLNNYHMYSSYVQDASNVYGFIGTLKRTDCSSCEAITIQINDDVPSSPNGPSNADSSIKVMNYPYTAGASTVAVGYKVQFNSSFTSGTASTYSWNFGDGGTSNLANPTHTYTLPGKYNACLTIASTGSCSSSICNAFPVNSSSTACRATIGVVNNFSSTVVFTCTTNGVPPYSYLWDFGDSATSFSMSPSHTYSVQGQYNVSLRLVDATSDTTYANYKVNTQFYSQCATNYSVTSVSTLTASTLSSSKVIVKWTDQSGLVYTSDNPSQPSTSYFQVLSVENYHDNESGINTKKIHAKIKCTVYNGSLSKLIDNADAIFVVGYK